MVQILIYGQNYNFKISFSGDLLLHLVPAHYCRARAQLASFVVHPRVETRRVVTCNDLNFDQMNVTKGESEVFLCSLSSYCGRKLERHGIYNFTLQAV